MGRLALRGVNSFVYTKEVLEGRCMGLAPIQYLLASVRRAVVERRGRAMEASAFDG